MFDYHTGFVVVVCFWSQTFPSSTPTLRKVRTDKRMVIQQEEQQWSLMLDNCDVLKKNSFLLAIAD